MFHVASSPAISHYFHVINPVVRVNIPHYKDSSSGWDDHPQHRSLLIDPGTYDPITHNFNPSCRLPKFPNKNLFIMIYIYIIIYISDIIYIRCISRPGHTSGQFILNRPFWGSDSFTKPQFYGGLPEK